jgi:hypothetical protein
VSLTEFRTGFDRCNGDLKRIRKQFTWS